MRSVALHSPIEISSPRLRAAVTSVANGPGHR